MKRIGYACVMNAHMQSSSPSSSSDDNFDNNNNNSYKHALKLLNEMHSINDKMSLLMYSLILLDAI